MGSPGASGQDDVSIENASTVSDFVTVLQRMNIANRALRDELSYVQADAATKHSQRDMEMAQMRVELRLAQAAGVQSQSQHSDKKFELIDVKTMIPAKFSGMKSDHFKLWAKKLKAYTNAKVSGFRDALELAEKSKVAISNGLIQSWGWNEGAIANTKLSDMLVSVCEGEALGLVEQVLGQGFEAWRLLNERYNSIGEMYTLDKMNSLMHGKVCKSIADMPIAIADFEKNLKVFSERTGQTFPNILKLPILMQMVPLSWKKEVEAHFRVPSATKTYESLSDMLCGVGNEERYKDRCKDPNDMELDAAEKEDDGLSGLTIAAIILVLVIAVGGGVYAFVKVRGRRSTAAYPAALMLMNDVAGYTEVAGYTNFPSDDDSDADDDIALLPQQTAAAETATRKTSETPFFQREGRAGQAWIPGM